MFSCLPIITKIINSVNGSDDDDIEKDESEKKKKKMVESTSEKVEKEKHRVNEEGKEIFAAHVHKILLQASLKGYSILFCYIVIDITQLTPIFRTLTHEQFIQSYDLTIDEETFKKSKENPRCMDNHRKAWRSMAKHRKAQKSTSKHRKAFESIE